MCVSHNTVYSFSSVRFGKAGY